MVPKLVLAALGVAGWIGVRSDAKVWTATLLQKDGSGIDGSARLESVEHDSTRATVTVKGAAPNASLSWGIHSGKCTALGAMLGGGGAYQSVQADSSGGGSATSTLKLELKSGTDYSVVVHGSAAGSVAACGELKAGG